MPSIGYLHFTDLHLGMGSQKWLWPNFKELFFEDLRRSYQRCGPWDLVIFSGDLVQSGQKVEFEQLERELSSLWALFSELGCKPVLSCVPGNHDLLRPDPTMAAVKIMQNWFDDPDVQRIFWGAQPNEYRDVVSNALCNYQSWFENTSIPILRSEHHGILPGDGAAILDSRGMTIGVVSLNSTFLQLTDADYEGHLDLDVRQLHVATGGDPNAWCRRADLNILVTHHNTVWLDRKAQNNFRSEIYPSGRFFAHFCGHLHNPDARDVREGGAQIRRQRLGTSLFGLERWGMRQEKRLHGYSAGRIELTSTDGIERLWPRIARTNYSGDWRIVPDLGYDLDDDNAMVTHFDVDLRKLAGDVKTVSSIPSTEDVGHTAFSELLEHKPNLEEPPPDWSLVAASLDNAAAQIKLQQVPRTHLRAEPQHLAVRKENQTHLELALRQKRAGWVIADWGLGKDGFLGCVLARFGLDRQHANVFRIRCEDVESVDALLASFDEQLILPFGDFLEVFRPSKMPVSFWMISLKRCLQQHLVTINRNVFTR